MIDSKRLSLTLYQDPTCPFCHRVMQFLRQIGRTIETKDTLHDRDAYIELLKNGGRAMVPCLKIEDEQKDIKWLYESRDIIEFLGKQFR